MSKTQIEYYPKSGFYIPVYCNRYLNRCDITGIIELTDLIECADTYKTEEKAREALGLAKEQRGKQNVKIIEI